MSVLASVAEESVDLEERFETKEVNEVGIYLMTFYINGRIEPVIVDDWIPTFNNKPAFSTTKTQELWPILMEKAWAKLHGTFARAEGGLPGFASMHVLGTPTRSYWHGDITSIDEFWSTLKQCDLKNYEMMAASHGQGEEQQKTGVISGHAYSLIAVKEFMHEDKLVRLAVLRNPWGEGEWNGVWSDKSELWTPELREKYGCKIEDDGTFHIPIEEYVKHYAWTSIAVDKSQNHKRSGIMKQFELSDTAAYFMFELQEEYNCEDIAFAVQCA